jgi:hypothetical protein
MAEEPRQPKKMTTAQLTKGYHALEQAFNNIAAAIGNDMAQVMNVLSGMLRHLDLLQDITCPSCGTELSHPKMDGVPAPDKCPACESDLELSEEE